MNGTLHSPVRVWGEYGIALHTECVRSHLSHYCHIFPWSCVRGGCNIIFCQLLHTYPGNTGALYPLSKWSLWCVQMVEYIMACGSCPFVSTLHSLSHYHHHAGLSEGIEMVKCICCRVCLRLTHIYQVPLIQYIHNKCMSSAYPILLLWLWGCLMYLIRVWAWNNGTRCAFLHLRQGHIISWSNSLPSMFIRCAYYIPIFSMLGIRHILDVIEACTDIFANQYLICPMGCYFHSTTTGKAKFARLLLAHHSLYEVRIVLAI